METHLYLYVTDVTKSNAGQFREGIERN